MKFQEILDIMIGKNVSDVFIRVNSNLKGRIYNQVKVIQDKVFMKEDVETMVNDITQERDKENLKMHRGCEFAYWYKEHWRFRIGIFYQRNTPSLVIRKIDLHIPSFEELGLPSILLKKFCEERRGMTILTGITGSGKSTTIASMIDYINKNFGRHILTIEEPIEFTFEDSKSVVNQREVGIDVENYGDALRQFALHSPDVIYIGIIRDAETCKAALTAAETGVLVLSTMHTINATSTVERIINFFPPYQQESIMNQLSFLLKGVFSQRLILCSDSSGVVPAYESMVLTPSISRLIREKRFWEIPKYISSGNVYGMKTFHQCLMDLITAGKITPEVALTYADKREELEMELRNIGVLK